MARHKNSDMKQLADMAPGEASWGAIYGDAYNTPGAKLAVRHYLARANIHHNPGKESAAEYSNIQFEISEVIRRQDSKKLREMADFFDAAKLARTGVFANEIYALAANFVSECMNGDRSPKRRFPPVQKGNKALMDALKKPPFFPSQGELKDFLLKVQLNKAFGPGGGSDFDVSKKTISRYWKALKKASESKLMK